MKTIKKIAERADAIFAEKVEKGFVNLSQDELEQTVTTLIKMLQELEVHTSQSQLSSRSEIYYFKVVKPNIAGRVMFIHKLLVYERSYLANSNNCHREFYRSILEEIREYIDANKMMFVYYSMKSESFDSRYFTLKQSSVDQCLNQMSIDCYSILTPKHSVTFANFVYCELLNDYISKRLEELNNDDGNELISRMSHLHWTGAKTNIVELGYSLFVSSNINGGVVTIKEIMDILSDMFNIDLGDYYRIFLDIKSRKKDRVSFLSNLRNMLLHKMNEDDI